MARYRQGDRISDLLLQRGDIAAQGALRSGDIWGGTVAGLGQQAAGYLAERQARKQNAQALAQERAYEEQAAEAEHARGIEAEAVERQAELGAAEDERARVKTEKQARGAFIAKSLEGFDGDFEGLQATLLPELGNEEATKVTKGLQAMQKTQREIEEGKEPELKDFQASVQGIAAYRRQVGDETFATQWPELRVGLQAGAEKFLGGMELPEEYGAEIGDGLEAIDRKWSGDDLETFTKKADITASARARHAAPRQRRLTPRQISVGNKTMMANYDSSTGRFYDPDTNEVLENVEAPESAMIRNRQAAANTSIEAGERLIGEIDEFADEIGPLMGRGNSILAQAGVGDPKAQYLVGAIRSFSALQPQIHGFRAHAMAREIEELLSTAQTPDALKAALQGIMTASYNVAEQPTPELSFGGAGGAQMEELSGLLAGLSPDELAEVLGE